jgi:hypothetical protein
MSTFSTKSSLRILISTLREHMEHVNPLTPMSAHLIPANDGDTEAKTRIISGKKNLKCLFM